jgi:hypothetical protein
MLELLETRTMLSVTWSNIGPSAILHGQVQGLGDDKVAGAVQAIAPYPDNANIIYIGTVNGGVWKTTNATEADPHWTPLTDGMPSLSIGDLALSPLNSQTIYAGTGKFSSASSDGGPGVGVYKSTNGGVSWTILGYNDFNGLSIDSIVPAAITGGQIVLAGTSDTQPTSDTPAKTRGGLFRSIDGGNTWLQLSGRFHPPGESSGVSYGLPDGPVSQIVRDPGDVTNLRFYAGLPGKGIFESDNGGIDWHGINGGIPLATVNGSNLVKLSVHSSPGHDVLDAAFEDTKVVTGVFQVTSPTSVNSWTSIPVSKGNYRFWRTVTIRT